MFQNIVEGFSGDDECAMRGNSLRLHARSRRSPADDECAMRNTENSILHGKKSGETIPARVSDVRRQVAEYF